MIILRYFLKHGIFSLVILFLFFQFSSYQAIAQTDRLDIYRIEPSLLNDYYILEKGTNLNLVLLNNVSTKDMLANNKINFDIPNADSLNIMAEGNVIKLSQGRRFSMLGSIGLSASKIILEDGQELNVSASSPLFTQKHSPHAYSSSLALARTITSLSLAASPATLGASLGVSFLVNGLLSAYQNGPSDFFWGGFNGVGLSFIEDILRKHPDVYLDKGIIVPFVLREDLKISKGINKEKIELLNITQEEAVTKIQNLIKWGDLTGALELSLKTNQMETYNKLIEKIEL